MSGVTKDEAIEMVTVSDLVTGCALKTVRALAGEKALLQVGAVIPVFTRTPRGKELIVKWISETEEKIYLKPTRLPIICAEQPEPLV